MDGDSIILSSLPAADLADLIRRVVREELTKAASNLPTGEEDIMTRKETARFLSVTLPTLRTYTRCGLLQAYRLGRRVFYRKSEVLACLTRLRYRAL
jgi:excisionase family DNA binding protein